MTDRAPADGDRPAPDAFFEGFDDYAAIVAGDLLRHRAIFRALGEWARLFKPGPFTLVDLGSGDSSFIPPTFTDTGLWRYTGVDTSPRALDIARTNLSQARFETRLVAADMLDWLAEAGASGASSACDAILAVYAVHHLSTAAKRVFFDRAFACLPPGGVLLYGDLFLRGDESREEWLAAFLDSLRAEWGRRPERALATAIAHVTASDYPETRSCLAGIAAGAGFDGTPLDLFTDPSGFNRLLCFTKPATSSPPRPA